MPVYGHPQSQQGADEGARIPWELHKENIQPLSHGRKMSQLNQSLSNSNTGGMQPRSDQEIDQALQELDEEIATYEGEEPLGVWVRAIAFYEQHCLTSGKYKSRYNELLKNCVRTFLNHDQVKNDKRFVDILIKGFSVFGPEKRVAIVFNSLMNQGVGRNVSRMYTQIAEDYEALKKYDKVNEILELGRTNNAQPAEFLEEFKTNFQFRVAERISQSMKEKEENSSAYDSSSSRLFGASVPIIGPHFEAQNLRTGLMSADPSRARPVRPSGNVAEPRKVSIYCQNENEIMPPPPPPAPKTRAEAVKEIEETLNDKLDKENLIRATKWNKPDTAMATAPAFNPHPPAASAGPIEKIQIYEDSEKSIVFVEAVHKPRKTLSRPVLGEKKLESEDEAGLKDKTSEPNKDVSVAVAAVAAPMNANIIKGLALPLPSEDQNPVGQMMPPVASNSRIMCRIKDLWQNGKEVTFEHLRVAEYMKRKVNAENLIKQTQNIVQAARGLTGPESMPNTAPPQPQPGSRVAELEAENAALKLHITELQTRQIEIETRNAELEARLIAAEIKANQDRSRRLEAMQKEQKQAKVSTSVSHVSASLNQGKENVFVEPTAAFGARSVIRPSYEFETSRRMVMEPDSDDTEAILTRQANIQPEFDLSNLTRALHFNPRPIHNSTPEKAVYEDMCDSGRIANVQGQGQAPVRPISVAEDFAAGGGGGAGQASIPAYTLAKSNFNATMHVGHNLSTIQENSKESRASNTTSSSGSTANYTKSAQKTGIRTSVSQLASSAHAHSNFQYNQGDWTN